MQAEAQTETQGLRTRAILASVLRVVVIIGVLMTAYWIVPLDPSSASITAAVWAGVLAVGVLLVVFLHQTRRILRSEAPMLAATETLLILLAIFLVGFAFIYLAVSTSEASAFSEPLNRTGAVYFAVTVLSTVGFGDITPESDGARWLVIIQMLIDIGLIAGALRLIFGMAKWASERRRTSGEASVADE